MSHDVCSRDVVLTTSQADDWLEDMIADDEDDLLAFLETTAVTSETSAIFFEAGVDVFSASACDDECLFQPFWRWGRRGGCDCRFLAFGRCRDRLDGGVLHDVGVDICLRACRFRSFHPESFCWRPRGV